VEQPVYPGPAFNLASGPAGATAATLAALGARADIGAAVEAAVSAPEN